MGHANAIEISRISNEDISELIKINLDTTTMHKSEFAKIKDFKKEPKKELKKEQKEEQKKEQNKELKRKNDNKKVLSILSSSKSHNVDKNLLKMIMECENLKILDTYKNGNVTTSIVKLQDLDIAVTIEQSSDSLIIKEKKPYVTKEMHECFIGEENECGYFSTAVKYLDEEEREKYRLEIKDGLFYQNGKPYNSESKIMGHTYAKFVMTKEGVFYCYENHCTGKFHHSSFLSGGPVALAGKIEIIEGMLLTINDKSDHYDPTTEMYKQGIYELQKRGVDTNGRIL